MNRKAKTKEAPRKKRKYIKKEPPVNPFTFPIRVMDVAANEITKIYVTEFFTPYPTPIIKRKKSLLAEFFRNVRAAQNILLELSKIEEKK